MRAVGDAISWVILCVFRCVYVVCWCLLCTQLQFWVRCFVLYVFVSDASGDHIVETYSSMGLVIVLYVSIVVSFCLPHVDDVSALSICIVLRGFVLVLSMCVLHESFGSIVSPSIFGLMFMGTVVLFIRSACCVLYSAVPDVKRVHVGMSGLRMRLIVCVHVCISCRYYLMFEFAIFMSLCVDVMVMSSAYVVSFTGACGVGVSDMYMLNNVADRMPHCGSSVLNWRCVDVCFWK